MVRFDCVAKSAETAAGAVWHNAGSSLEDTAGIVDGIVEERL